MRLLITPNRSAPVVCAIAVVAAKTSGKAARKRQFVIGMASLVWFQRLCIVQLRGYWYGPLFPIVTVELEKVSVLLRT
jgi:hypothetical protein